MCPLGVPFPAFPAALPLTNSTGSKAWPTGPRSAEGRNGWQLHLLRIPPPPVLIDGPPTTAALTHTPLLPNPNLYSFVTQFILDHTKMKTLCEWREKKGCVKETPH